MTHSSADADALTAARDAVLAFALTGAGAIGWTQQVLDAAIAWASIDLPLAARAFPHGPQSLVEAFHAAADRTMLVHLQQHDIERLRVGERVAMALRFRIEAMERPAARRALAFQARPENLASSARTLTRTVDAIWRAVGDRSLDFSFYTKRATLAAVTAATVLVWIDDDSDDCAETWAFLNRRLRDVAAFGRSRARARAQNAVAGAATAALDGLKNLSALRRRSTGWRETRPAPGKPSRR